MLQKAFSIYNDYFDECVLYIETGKLHLALWIATTESKSVQGFEFFRFEETDAENFEETLYQVKQNSRLFSAKLSGVQIITEEATAMAIPSALYEKELNEDYLMLMHGSNGEMLINTDVINGITFISAQVPKKLFAFKKYFPLAATIHKQALLIKKYARQKKTEFGNTINIVLYPEHFIITALKSGELHLIQSREYSNAEDVLYMILNTCTQNHLALKETLFTICGLIDEQSSLYNLLHMYLENLVVECTTESILDAEGFREFPAHYFASFFNYMI